MNCTSLQYSSIETNEKNFKLEKKRISKLVENVICGKSFFNYSNRILRLVPADAIRYTSQTKALKDLGVYRNALINFVFSCENKCSGSGIIFLMMLTNLGLKENYKKIRIERRDIKNVLSFYLGKGKILENVIDVFFNFGFEYNLRFSKTEHDVFGYNRRSALKIDGSSDPAFLEINHESPSIIVTVDGTIETVGELDSMLQWSINNKKPIVLLNRGISPDVSNTLKVNWDSGKLKVWPFVINDDYDLNSGVSAQIVSAETGLRVSNIDLDEFKIFDSVECNHNKIMVSNVKGRFNDIEFLLPIRDTAIHSIMEERILCATSIVKNACISGVTAVECLGKEFLVPDICLDYAKQALKEWNKIEDIGCVVTLQQKN